MPDPVPKPPSAPPASPQVAASAPAAQARSVRASRSSRSSFGVGSEAYPNSVTRLIDELARLPGIGRRSAERLAFHILKTPADDALALARAISDVKQSVRHCRVCYNLADAATGDTAGLCAVCADPARDRSMVMVVEQPKDLIALEQTGAYRGLYHVLMGRISPLEGITPGDLTLHDLFERIEQPTRNAGHVGVRELVLALNPTFESDGTALYISSQIARRPGVRLTRLARGVPSGAQLEYASKAVLIDAIEGRRSIAP